MRWKRKRSSRARTRARRYRRNPGGFSLAAFKPRAIASTAMQSAVNALAVIGGKGSVRFVRSKIGIEAGTIAGSAVELGTALVFGALLRGFSPRIAEHVTTGGFVSVEEAFLKQMNIPFVSGLLGDEDPNALDLGGSYDLGDVDLDELAGYDVSKELGGTYDLGARELGEGVGLGEA